VLGGIICRIGGPDGPAPPPSFRLTTSSLPDPVRGQPYGAGLAASGGTPPYTWTVTGLPAGLRLDGDTIVGTPTTPGDAIVEVVVRDHAGLTRSVTLSMFTQDPDVVGSVQPISDDPLSLWQGTGSLSMSDDASMVAFTSSAALDPLDPVAGSNDVFTLDRATDTVRRIVRNQGDYIEGLQISGDGGTVVFATTAALVVEDTNGTWDVYAADAAGAWIRRVSTGAAQAYGQTVSNDGQTVAFAEGGVDGVVAERLLVWDRPTGTISALAGGNGGFWNLDLSDDTSRLTFISSASDLVPGDDNGVFDLFTAELSSGAIARLDTGEGAIQSASLSGDGGTLAFTSDTTDFPPPGDTDTNGGGDIFLLDLPTGAVTRLTNGDAPSSGSIVSEDGQAVAFSSQATDIASGERDRNEAMDAFIWNGETGLISRLTRSPRGSGTFDISGDGRMIAFNSLDPDLSPARPVEPITGWIPYLWTRTN
jgi:Tol biopolymer transport system component